MVQVLIDKYAAVRDSVTTREFAETAGIQVNRSGFCSCPFHSDRTPSLKIYDEGGWYCFSCNRGGSVIDLAAALYNTDILTAAQMLSDTFYLGLDFHNRKPPNAAEMAQIRRRRQLVEARRLFESWRERTALQLAQAHRTGYIALINKSSDTWTDAEVLAVKWMPVLADWADALDGAPSEQMMIFRDREGVMALCEKILVKDNLTKSLTA